MWALAAGAPVDAFLSSADACVPVKQVDLHSEATTALMKAGERLLRAHQEPDALSKAVENGQGGPDFSIIWLSVEGRKCQCACVEVLVVKALA